MIGGSEANLVLVPYAPEKVKQLAKLAHDLGVLIHIAGIPFGDSTAHLTETTGSGALQGIATPGVLGDVSAG